MCVELGIQYGVYTNNVTHPTIAALFDSNHPAVYTGRLYTAE